MLTLDGSAGEGGGQVLRSALSLSLVTGIPFHMEGIRAGRRKPGLRPQHVAAARAAAAVGEADLAGAERGSNSLTFHPRTVRGGAHHFSVGTAGSACLVLQTVLPPLLVASETSSIEVEGGTHNPMAPPFEYLARVYLPLLERMGPQFHARLVRHGFAPGGGGRFRVDVEPVERLEPLHLLERGPTRRLDARALVANLDLHIAERELRVVQKKLGWPKKALHVEVPTGVRGPGNALLLAIQSEHVTEMFTAFGERGVRAETVAAAACMEALAYLDADVPVGEHLADQLLLPLALAEGGSFRTLPLSSHARTQVELIGRFLDVTIRANPAEPKSVLVEVEPAP